MGRGVRNVLKARSLAVAAAAAALGGPAAALAAQPAAPAAALTVERLLTEGWEVAAYGPLTLENRSFILFKHADRKYLVQCSVLYDVTRAVRVQTNCYEIR